jgi:NO-binding membrane sensor protein with MHYT domain
MTAASFFVPILVLLLAFFVVTGSNNNSTEVRWWRVGVSGTLSGGAICGMHYLGNASISNYHCDYAVGNVAGSAVIAAAASTVALALFFVFRSAWTGSWWKRIGCAVVLAGAVSGMHWCAALGTRYTLLVVNEVGEYGPRNTTSVVISCLVSKPWKRALRVANTR